MPFFQCWQWGDINISKRLTFGKHAWSTSFFGFCLHMRINPNFYQLLSCSIQKHHYRNCVVRMQWNHNFCPIGRQQNISFYTLKPLIFVHSIENASLLRNEYAHNSCETNIHAISIETTLQGIILSHPYSIPNIAASIQNPYIECLPPLPATHAAALMHPPRVAPAKPKPLQLPWSHLGSC